MDKVTHFVLPALGDLCAFARGQVLIQIRNPNFEIRTSIHRVASALAMLIGWGLRYTASTLPPTSQTPFPIFSLQFTNASIFVVRRKSWQILDSESVGVEVFHTCGSLSRHWPCSF
jgi:hypothetical protein